MKKKMTKKEHIQRHEELHNFFDELIADFIIHNPEKFLNNTTINELTEWSFYQTKNPTENKD